MQDILQNINSVEGVVGSAVFSQKGHVVAHSFPALIDASSLDKAANIALECAHGLQISQSLEFIDLRYSDGRLLIKKFSNSILFLLCAKNVNLQVLFITLNLAVKKLELLLNASQQAPPASAPTDMVQADGVLQMQIRRLANKQASASFDSLGMIAISQVTSQRILEFYKTSFSKLTLTSTSSGVSGTYPVMVMKDMESRYDGAIVVGPGIEKKLKVVEGDIVAVGI
jgi:predicted regulator of Ras-like GTPase activity (Roadblock/LC7/MglB family)